MPVGPGIFSSSGSVLGSIDTQLWDVEVLTCDLGPFLGPPILLRDPSLLCLDGFPHTVAPRALRLCWACRLARPLHGPPASRLDSVGSVRESLVAPPGPVPPPLPSRTPSPEERPRGSADSVQTAPCLRSDDRRARTLLHSQTRMRQR